MTVGLAPATVSSMLKSLPTPGVDATVREPPIASASRSIPSVPWFLAMGPPHSPPLRVA